MFKFDKDKDRFFMMHPVACLIAMDMAFWSLSKGLPFTITSTMSSLEEDKRIGRKSRTHREGRAFDLSVKGWSSEDIDEFIVHFCKKYEEHSAISSQTLQPKLVVYHVGTAAHFHVQVHPRYTMENSL